MDLENIIEDCDIEKIMKHYGNQIMRLCFIYLKNHHQAEDATQETFIQVYKNYGRFEKKCSEKTWITQIAINICKNMMKSSWIRRVDTRSNVDDKSLVYEDKYSDDTVLNTIMNLKPIYKEIVILYYYQELKFNEISEALSIPLPTVLIRHKRAKEILSKQLKGWYFDEEQYTELSERKIV